MKITEITAPWAYISRSDPAIDDEAPGFDWRRYRETQDDAFAPRKQGAVAARFVLKRLSYEERQDVDVRAEVSATIANEHAARVALTDVQGLELEAGPFVLSRAPNKPVEAAVLRQLGNDLVQEIGEAARAYARLSFRRA